jgi:DNA-binding Lrp family transcriptional regulator
MDLSESDRRLLATLERGLELVPRPFAALGSSAGLSEEEAIRRVSALARQGIVRRFGLIVRHHELGYRANAMVVWDIPDERVDAVGARMAEIPFITLCYRRPRRLPDWPYNLFCMIHGKERAAVEAQVKEVADALDLSAAPREVLFSVRRFKQEGARYFAASLDGAA